MQRTKRKRSLFTSHPALLSALILGVVYFSIVTALFLAKDSYQYAKAVPIMTQQVELVQTYAPSDKLALQAARPFNPPRLQMVLIDAPDKIKSVFQENSRNYYSFMQDTNHIFTLLLISLTIVFGVIYSTFL